MLFPNLSKLARRVLCVPATSASSERMFSHAGLTVTKNRARLLPENAEMLIFLHDTWPVADAWTVEQQKKRGNDGKGKVERNVVDS